MIIPWTFFVEKSTVYWKSCGVFMTYLFWTVPGSAIAFHSFCSLLLPVE